MSGAIHMVEYESRRCSCEGVKAETMSGMPFYEGEDRERIAETTVRMSSKNENVVISTDEDTGEIVIRIFGESAHESARSAFWFLSVALKVQARKENRSIIKHIPK